MAATMSLHPTMSFDPTMSFHPTMSPHPTSRSTAFTADRRRSRTTALTFEPRWAGTTAERRSMAGGQPFHDGEVVGDHCDVGSCAATTSAARRLDPAVYRRRRFAVGLGLALLGAVGWTLATWATNSAIGVDPVGADRSGLPAEVHVVQPGDTLWSIAAELDTDGDVRDTVDLLAERNGGSALTVGQRLVLGG